MNEVHKWFGDLHVLNDVNLKVNRGEKIVICGPSGSGKSTLSRLISGIIPPSEGAILVDGVDVRQIEKSDIRKNIDLVACLFGFESRFFDENRIPNIHMGHPLVSTQRIWEANVPEYSELSSSKKENLIALVPGSRISEIKKILILYPRDKQIYFF